MEQFSALRRSTSDRKVSGLAGGLARAWNIDPLLIRIGFAVLALSGGIGVVLYLAGWLMVPEEGHETSRLEEAIPQSRTWSREVKVAIVAIACVIGLVAGSSIAPFPAVAALVVLAIWYFGYYRNRPRTQSGAGSDSAGENADAGPAGIAGEPTQFIKFGDEQTPFTEAAKAWQLRIGDYLEAVRSSAPNAPSGQHRTGTSTASDPSAPGAPGAPSGSPSDPAEDPARAAYFSHPDPVGLYTPAQAKPPVPLTDPRVAARKRSSRRLGLVSLVVLGLSMTGLGVASALGAAISPATYLATALLVMGLTLLAGTRYGRPPGMAFGAVIVAIAMLGALFTPQATQMVKTWGMQEVNYVQPAALPPSDQFDAGNFRVDLSDLELDRSRTYSATVDSGRLEVVLPDDVDVQVRGTVGDGMLQFPDQQVRWGSDITMNLPAPQDASDPILTLDLRVDSGQLEVTR